MKMRIDNIIKILLLILFVILLSFYAKKTNKPDFDQAERIAAWKSVYEELNYSFDLVKLYEGSIIPDGDYISAEKMQNRIKPYFNPDDKTNLKLKRYKYAKYNRTPVRKDYPYYFNDFFYTKNGLLLSVKENPAYTGTDDKPGYFLFIDINYKDRPNRIGKDIFFMNIYKNKVTAAGFGADRETLKKNCSPFGSGVYCSQHYLLGGKF